MGDMRIGHEVIVIPNDGPAPAIDCTPMNGDELPESVIISYFDNSLFPLIRNVLRLSSNGGEGRKPTTLSYFCFPGDMAREYLKM